MSTVSAPGGIWPTVKMRAALPTASGCGEAPAGMRWLTGSTVPACGTSAQRRAYPSIAVLSAGGTSSVERRSSASTRPRASKVETLCASAAGSGRTAASSRSSACASVSMGGRGGVVEEWGSVLIALGLAEEEMCHGVRIVEVEDRQAGGYGQLRGAVGGDRDDERVVGV